MLADRATPALTIGLPQMPRRKARPPGDALLRMWSRFARNRGAVGGLSIVLLFFAIAVVAPLSTSLRPLDNALDQALLNPSSAHLLGTDHLGRDILARMVYGARASLLIGFAAVGVGLTLGVPLGAMSGFYGGWVDLLIQRVIDVLLSFPGFLLALALVAVLGVGLENVIVAVGIGVVPAFVRLVRAATLAIRMRPFVEAARASGATGRLIIWRHVLPNIAPAVVIQATLGLGSTLLTAAGLGFLGLGVQQPTPEWGAMLGEGRSYFFSNPYLATAPGLAIFLTVLGFNLAGDGLRDALDPTLDRAREGLAH